MVRATFDKGAKMRRFEKALANPEKALKQIGVLGVAESHEAFTLQRLGDVGWPPRGKVNVMGIIADFAKGSRKPPARRFQRRPALFDTGRLSGSINFRFSASGRWVEWGALAGDPDYASKHQFGGETESETITEDLQTRLWKWLQKQSSELKQKLGFILNKKWVGDKIPGSVPARPFVGITRQLIADVEEVVGVLLLEVR